MRLLEGDGSSYSVALQRALSDGYIKNTTGNADTTETWHGSLRFSLDRGNGSKIGFGANFETHELGAQPLVLRNGGDFYDRASDFDESTEIDRNQQFLTFEHELDGYSFFSITNRNDWNMNPNRVDLDTSTVNTLASPAQTSVIIQDQIEWSQEFRVESNIDSEIDWVLGAFYSDSEIDGDATRSFGVTEQTVYNLESCNIAIFASLDKDLTESDNLSLGLRYDNFEKKMDRMKDGFNFTLIRLPYTDNFFADSNDFDSLSPTLNWERKITEGLTGNLRATYSEKPGGFSAYTVNGNQITFLEEETLSYEIGLLFSPTESWGLNFTAYLNDIENYQFELPDLNPLSTDY